MMVEAGTEPVSDLSCNRGNRGPIDPQGERPGISSPHTLTVKMHVYTHREHTQSEKQIDLLNMNFRLR